MSALDMATLEVAGVTMFIMALIVRFGVFSRSISQHPEMEWAEDRKIQASVLSKAPGFGAGEMVVLGGCPLHWSVCGVRTKHPELTLSPRMATTEQPQHHYREEGGSGEVWGWRKCDPEQLGSFDRGRPSCSTRVGKLGPSRFRFHSGNAQHPASEAVSPLSVSHGEASLNSTFSYNTSPPAGPTQRRSVPRPQAKAKQFNPRAVQTIGYQHQA
ncbi:hypothetical protein NCU04286 [Neurospora crassa OR74A]|uniref:Uncharacterized protein n=2 Tax=Neurospora crassa TaxID=5141 RepID=Q1K783_NEUCR|nr:hypothetical protein NCU04286 [Neurospora crassa OR74A]EAA31840.1 hypothetical protein NCU04286 [Neurospora crassa OR74A]CAD11373.1 hypothetical protein [Neurospora crassa]|eukprot:XP_961076.1 hypothetical protein NCU04286 [Neurospora crassa OR74A]